MTRSRSQPGTGASDPVAPHAQATAEGQPPQPGKGGVESGGGDGTPPLNFDDEEIYSGRGKALRAGGTANAQGGDSGRLGPPSEQLSDRNGPSVPDRSRPKG